MPDILDVFDTQREQSATAVASPVEEAGSVLHAFDTSGPAAERYQQARQQMTALRSAKDAEADQEESPGGYLLRRSIPFISAGHNFFRTREYGKAKERYQKGTSQPGDYRTIAEYERLQEIDQNRTTGESVISGLASIPAIAGEAWIGGGALRGAGLLGSAAIPAGASVASRIGSVAGRAAAQTAVMPSMYLEGTAQRAVQNGGEWYNPQNFAPAYALGFMQTAILGSLGNVGNSITGEGVKKNLQRWMTKTGVGMAEQGVADVLASTVSLALPEAWKIETGFGLVGDIIRGAQKGDFHDALKHATVQAVTFAAFSAMHGIKDKGVLDEPVWQAYLKMMEEKAKSKNGRNLTDVFDSFNKLREVSPDVTQAQARAWANDYPPGTERDFALSIADLMPTTAAPIDYGAADRAPVRSPVYQQGESARSWQRQEPKPEQPVDLTDKIPVREPVGPEQQPSQPQRSRYDTPISRGNIEAAQAKRAASGKPPLTPQELVQGTADGTFAGFVRDPEGRHFETAATLMRAMSTRRPVLQDVEKKLKASGVSDSFIAGIAKRVKVSGATSGEEWYKWARDNKAYPGNELANEYAAILAGREGGTSLKPKPVEVAREQVPPVEPATAPPAPEAAPVVPPAPEATAVEPQKVATQPAAPVSQPQESAPQVTPEPPVKPEPQAKPMDVLAQRAAKGEPITPQEIFQAAELDAREQSILLQRLAGKAFSDIEGVNTGARGEQLQNGYTKKGKHVPGLIDKLGPFGEKIKAAIDAAVEDAKQGRQEGGLGTEIVKGKSAPKDLQEHQNDLFLAWDKIGEDPAAISDAADAIIGIERHLNKSGLNVKKWLAENVPNFDAAEAKELITLAKEAGNDSKQLSKRLRLSEAALRRILDASIQVEIKADAVHDAPQGPEGGTPESSAPVAAGSEAGGNVVGDIPGQPKNAFANVEQPTLERWAKDDVKGAIAELERRAAEKPGPIREFLNDETGTLDLDALREGLKEKWDWLKTSAQHVRDNMAELASKMFPRATRLHRETGEAMGRLAYAGEHAKILTPDMIDKTVGKNATKADRLLYGNAAVEMRLRHMRDYYEQAARAATDPAEKQSAQDLADGVTTTIGPDSPIKTDAEYNRVIASPEMQAIVERWGKFMKQVMEDNFRRATGMDDTDPINAPTQMPDFPINLKAVTGEDPGVFKTYGGKRGNVRNVKEGKFHFAEQAKGDAEAYELDMGSIIEHSLKHGLQRAAEREWRDTGIEGGVLSYDSKHLFDGVRGKPIQFKGSTQTLYVDPRAYGEAKNVLALNDPTKIPGFTDVAPWLIKASLASTVELAYHSKNLLTFLMKPGIRPWDIIKNTYGVIGKEQWAKDRIIELARIGAMKEHGMESGDLSKYNPLKWGGDFLDVLQKIMRLTGEDAFDRLHKQGSAVGTETNKRDFINQLGQYNKLAQNRLIVVLRDTQLGPFATAGSNYLMQGLRSVALMDPGVTATSFKHAVAMRAEGIAKLAAVISATALANYMMWGKVDGDDKTPLGAIKVGKDAKGKTMSWDLVSMTGLTRGLRATGALAFLEGTHQGLRPGQKVDRAVEGMIGSVLHPAEGPAVAFLHTAATGKNTIGMQVAEKLHHGSQDSQAWKNLQAALWNANPLLASLTGHTRAARPGQEPSAGERFNQLLGPYGLKFRGR